MSLWILYSTHGNFVWLDWTCRALGGFVITTTPVSCCLMGWRGASGNGVAFMWENQWIERAPSNELNSGPIIFLGGLLLLITSILEFIIGNTFPCVVFGTIGKSSYLMIQASLTSPCCWYFTKAGFGLRLQPRWFQLSMQPVSLFRYIILPSWYEFAHTS